MKIFLSVLIAILLFNSKAQETCFIRFSNLELLKTCSANSQFLINGVFLKPDSLVHKIEISKSGFDSVGYTTTGSFGALALAKFQESETYTIRLNPCSFYEVVPVSNPMNGMLKWDSLSANDTLIGLFDEEESFLWMGKGTDYIKPMISAMCPFSPKKIEVIRVLKSQEAEGEVLSSLQFHFLHGEKVVATFDSQSSELKLTIAGYIK